MVERNRSLDGVPPGTITLDSVLIKIQAELKVPKTQLNKFGNYKYRSCEDILEAVKPILAKNNVLLTISDDVVLIGDWHYVKATACLTIKEQIITVSAFAREEPHLKGMEASKITGATSSYARKYALNAMFLIDDVKDADSDSHAGNQSQGDDPYADDAKKAGATTNEPHGEPIDGAPKEVVGLVDTKVTVQTEKKGGGKLKSPLYKISVKGFLITTFSETHAKIARECFEKKKQVHASYEEKQLNTGKVYNAVEIVAAEDVPF